LLTQAVGLFVEDRQFVMAVRAPGGPDKNDALIAAARLGQGPPAIGSLSKMNSGADLPIKPSLDSVDGIVPIAKTTGDELAGIE